MKKYLLFLLLVAGIVISSCVPATTMPSFVETPVEATVAVTEAPAIPVKTPVAQATEAPAEVPVVSGPATCQVDGNILVPPNATQTALAAAIPPVTDADWSRGKPDAKYTILEYSDFMCPYCAALSPILDELLAARPDDVRLVFRHFPLPSHPLSILSTQAAEAAGLQGKFWEVTDYLLQNQAEWSSLEEPAYQTYLLNKAESWGLDKVQFTKDLTNDAIVNKANTAQEQAMKAGIDHTPFLMLNDRVLLDQESQNLALVIHLLSSQETNYKVCPPPWWILPKRTPPPSKQPREISWSNYSQTKRLWQLTALFFSPAKDGTTTYLSMELLKIPARTVSSLRLPVIILEPVTDPPDTRSGWKTQMENSTARDWLVW